MNKSLVKIRNVVATSVLASSLLFEGMVGSTTTFAAASTAPVASTITVTNNLTGTPDTVVVSGLAAGDVVKVYASSSATTAIGDATVASGQTSASVSIAQLGKLAGNVYVTVTKSGETESTKTLKAYIAEPVTTAPAASSITVTNNVLGTNDTVALTGLVAGDVVKVYASTTATTTLGTATVASGQTTASINIAQLGKLAGKVYVTVTSTGKLESTRTLKDFSAEPVSTAPVASNITVVNNKLSVYDTISVTGVAAGDIVKVYSSATATTPISGKTVASGQTSVSFNVYQLGKLAGNIYVSVKSPNKNESPRTQKSYASEATVAPAASSITVTNNFAGTPDTVALTGLVAGDVVKVYASSIATTPLGTATVASGQTTASVNVAQLGKLAGKVYVTVTTANRIESARTIKDFNAEVVSNAPVAGNITITNNIAGTNDTVALTGLAAGDVVKVYATAASTTTLGTATVASGQTTASVNIAQLGKLAGKVYVTVTSTGKNESVRTEKAFSAETVSTAPVAGNITITNNIAGTNDTVALTGLAAGDVVKVYATPTATTTLGTATVASGQTTASINIAQLGKLAGKVYVTVTSTSKLESVRTLKDFSAEPVSTSPVAGNITITNNIGGTDDTVALTGLAAGDVVKIYATPTATTTLGTATVASGQTTASIDIAQLGKLAGKVYVTVTSTGKNESLRTEKAFSAEPVSTSPVAGNITITNNIGGTDDTVALTGLAAGDVVKIYATPTATTTLGTATVASGQTTASINIAQLGKLAGKVYVTVISTNKLESVRTEKTFSAEPVSTAPVAGNITITNNIVSANDTVALTGLTAGDVVTVYATPTATTALGTATVASGQTTASIDIAQLGKLAGKVYVTVTSTNKLESTRTEKAYIAEPVSVAPSASAITITNNTEGTDDTIAVTGLVAGDIVTVYADSKLTRPLEAGTVASGQTSVTLNVFELGSTGGTVYVTVTSANKYESVATAKTFSAEA